MNWIRNGWYGCIELILGIVGILWGIDLRGTGGRKEGNEDVVFKGNGGEVLFCNGKVCGMDKMGTELDCDLGVGGVREISEFDY